DEMEALRQDNERLRSLYDDAKAGFHQALAAAQAEFKTLKRDNDVKFKTLKGGEFSASTASMDAAYQATQDALTKNGITVRQPVIDHPTDRSLSLIRTILAYRGYEEHYDLSIASPISHHQKQGGDMKEFGSDVTLIRKYALM